ncbi:MAG: uncharacterized protein QG632_889 [Candidatus Dependentiae bacterium]|nr:uncharacterized protein [Candidatus Dependentiae bacterium]
MTAAFVWNELKKMVVIDHEINQLRKTAKKEQEHFNNSNTAHQKKVATLAEAEHTIRDLQKKIDHGELSVRELRTQLQRKRNQLASMVSAKERTATEHEIEKITAEIDAVETITMTVLDQQEVVKATLEKIKSEVSLSSEAIESLRRCNEIKCQECQANIAALEQEWGALLPQVPAELRKEYLQMKERVANPAVPIVDNTCSACFTNLLGQEITGLSTRAVIRCRSCYRFLYVPDATTATLSGK